MACLNETVVALMGPAGPRGGQHSGALLQMRAAFAALLNLTVEHVTLDNVTTCGVRLPLEVWAAATSSSAFDLSTLLATLPQDVLAGLSGGSGGNGSGGSGGSGSGSGGTGGGGASTPSPTITADIIITLDSGTVASVQAQAALVTAAVTDAADHVGDIDANGTALPAATSGSGGAFFTDMPAPLLLGSFMDDLWDELSNSEVGPLLAQLTSSGNGTINATDWLKLFVAAPTLQSIVAAEQEPEAAPTPSPSPSPASLGGGAAAAANDGTSAAAMASGLGVAAALLCCCCLFCLFFICRRRKRKGKAAGYSTLIPGSILEDGYMAEHADGLRTTPRPQPTLTITAGITLSGTPPTTNASPRPGKVVRSPLRELPGREPAAAAGRRAYEALPVSSAAPAPSVSVAASAAAAPLTATPAVV